MKFRYLVLTILVIGALVYFLRPKGDDSEQLNSEKAITFYISPEIDTTYKEKVRQWANQNNQKIDFLQEQDEAKVVINKKQIDGYKSEEVGKAYSNQYESQGNFTFERKSDPIYIGFKEKKISSLVSTFKTVNWNMFAAGDMMLSRTVGVKMRNTGDWSYPFNILKNNISKFDVSFANLESPFNEQGQIYDEGMTFAADPKAIKGLTESGFDIISLANNHFGNMQNAGMTYTMDFLNKNQIKYTGAGKTTADSCEAKYVNVKGLKIAFLAVDGVDSTPVSYRADSQYPGLCSWLETTRIGTAIKNAKSKADFIVMSMHAGTEYKPIHRSDQEEFAHKVINNGVNLVIGTHPHVVQDIETYKNGLIFYSLGNFVFDQTWSQETQQGLTIELSFTNGQITKYQIKPVLINSDYQPNYASEMLSKEIMTRIGVK
jgi:poly-gamma-glutamate synthesis protein (capsule biosynthesis protein)